MTSFEFGEIILVPFPFTDKSATKKRPAVVISSTKYHDHRPDVILLAITSQLHASAFGDVSITAWQAAGLLKPSVFKPLIATIERKLIVQVMGRLQSDDTLALHRLLESILGT